MLNYGCDYGFGQWLINILFIFIEVIEMSGQIRPGGHANELHNSRCIYCKELIFFHLKDNKLFSVKFNLFVFLWDDIL